MVFLELRCHCGFAHEVRWGTQGASCVVLGKSVFLLVLDSKDIKPINPKEINSEYSLEGLMLKLKLQYFGHLMRRDNSLEKKTLML